MMNKNKLKAFRDWFCESTLPYAQACTTGCIAYHAHVWKDGKDDARPACPLDLVHIFGVSKGVATLMFNHPTHWTPSKNDAADMLDKLIETGKVEWPA